MLKKSFNLQCQLHKSSPMPRKKSVKTAAERFIEEADGIVNFSKKVSGLQDTLQDWFFDYAIIRLYGEFETLMLDALSGAINNDATAISSATGFSFPKHINWNVCKYLIVGKGYFDFKGRDHLIQIVKDFVPDTHYLVQVLKQRKYKDALEKLSAFRNFAAHNSEKAKAAAKKAIGGGNLGSAGSWLKKQNRFEELAESLKHLAKAIERKAPY
jgi:hypothetical protein